ncbi:MAG: MFS transporter [Verrucomicrobia bacterium]|nr:MFS transporter [Verrucomicrobiota bacterium]
MREILKNIFAPILSLFIIMVGVSFFNSYISLRVTAEGWNNFIAGSLTSAYYAGMMSGALYMERIIRQIGHIRSFSLFATTTSSAIILQGFFNSPFVWLFFRFLTGVGCAGLFVVIESWLLLLSTATTQGVVLSLYMVALYTAQSLSQFILNFTSLTTLTAFNVTALFSCLSIVPVTLMRAAAPSSSTSEYVNIFYLFRKVPLGFLGNFVAGLVLSAFYALGPVFARESGFSMFHISLILAGTVLGGMVLQWPIGLCSDIMERRKVIIITAMTLAALSLFIFFYPTMPFSLLLLSLFLWGGFSFTLYPISITYCCDFFSSAGITSVTCAALIIYGIGCVIGPLLAPIFMELTTPFGLFLYSAFLALALGGFALWKQRKLPEQNKETKEPYQVLPGTTPQVSSLDPRQE